MSRVAVTAPWQRGCRDARGAANTTNQQDGLFTPGTVMAAMLNPDGSPSLWVGSRIAIA
jgi:hypothetical protein